MAGEIKYLFVPKQQTNKIQDFPKKSFLSLNVNIAALLCHGVFNNPDTGNLQLVLSEPGLSYQCLDYREREGVVEGRFLSSTCQTNNNNNIYVNISSTGPCILPLTAGENTGTSSSPSRQTFPQSILGCLILVWLHHIYLRWEEEGHLLLHLLIGRKPEIL